MTGERTLVADASSNSFVFVAGLYKVVNIDLWHDKVRTVAMGKHNGN